MAVDWVMRGSSEAPAPKEDPISSLKFRDFSAGGSSLLRDQNGMMIYGSGYWLIGLLCGRWWLLCCLLLVWWLSEDTFSRDTSVSIYSKNRDSEEIRVIRRN